MKFTLVFTILLMIVVGLAKARVGCFCTADYKPVCGQDGRTYSNSCRLGCANIEFDYNGECGKKE